VKNQGKRQKGKYFIENDEIFMHVAHYSLTYLYMFCNI